MGRKAYRSSARLSIPQGSNATTGRRRGSTTVKKFSAVLASACAVLALAGAAAAAPVVGVSEDATKYASDGGASLYAKMKGYGLSSNRISVFWDYTKPTTIPEKQYLDKVVPA